MSKPLQIVLLGLPRHHPKTPPHIGAQLDLVVSQMRKRGVDINVVSAAPRDGIDNLQRQLQKATAVDGVVIGWGLRGMAENTVWFEQVINTVKDVTPAAKLMFNTMPEDTVDAVKRWFSF